MNLRWKSFQIDLDSMHEYLKNQLGDNYDGMIANDHDLKICFYNESTEQEHTIINNYWDSLVAEEEASKIHKRTYLFDKIKQIKLAMLLKSYDQLSELEKKLLLNIELTDTDKEAIWQS